MFSISKGIRLLTVIVLATIGQTAFATDWENKQIGYLRSPDTRPCIIFNLVGVNEADPVTPGVSWMAVRKSAQNYKEILAMLLVSKVTGRPVNVSTTGTIASECGHVEVLVVSLSP